MSLINIYLERIESLMKLIGDMQTINNNLEVDLALWKADAERLAIDYWETGDDFDVHVCKHCCRSANDFTKIPHAPDCPIALHRELVEKYGGEE